VLSEKIEELNKSKTVREKIWCTNCKVEWHHDNECPLLLGGMAWDPIASFFFKSGASSSGSLSNNFF